MNLSVNSRILYQNESCAAVNKLKGEAVEGAPTGTRGLNDELKAFLGAETAEAVHRLDVPVTGCALFALNKPSLTFLNDAFAGRIALSSPIKKIYWAITEKKPHSLPESGELVHWIAASGAKNKSFACDKDGPGRKKAVLRYKITGEGRNYLFFEINLLTGRHHQIRAQLAAAGLPIKGDLKYGAKRSEKEGGIRLHARSLSFPNPLDKSELINVTADLPIIDKLWADFIEQASHGESV